MVGSSMIIRFEDSYEKCADCGFFEDGGNFKNGKYYCHDCIDKPNNKVDKTDQE